MKSRTCKTFLAALLLLTVNGVAANEIAAMISEPDKVVLTLRAEGKPVTGACGGTDFDIKRTNQNFNELYPLLLTAFSQGWPVTIHTFPCHVGNKRNPVSHAEVVRPLP